MFKRLCKIVSPLGNGVCMWMLCPPEATSLFLTGNRRAWEPPHPWMKVGPQSPGPACRVGSLGALPGGSGATPAKTESQAALPDSP